MSRKPGDAIDPFRYGQTRLAHLMTLAAVAQASANGEKKRSANVVVADRLGVPLNRVTEALHSLEEPFGKDLQVQGAVRRTGRLTAKGRSIAAAAGILQMLLEVIDQDGADHEAIVKFANETIDALLQEAPKLIRRPPGRQHF